MIVDPKANDNNDPISRKGPNGIGCLGLINLNSINPPPTTLPIRQAIINAGIILYRPNTQPSKQNSLTSPDPIPPRVITTINRSTPPPAIAPQK
ncbi:hypothetical protein D3C74_301130 [compost metagenome]